MLRWIAVGLGLGVALAFYLLLRRERAAENPASSGLPSWLPPGATIVHMPPMPSWAAALREVPGPSPWYLVCPGTEVESARGLLKWERAGDGVPWDGKSVLRSPDGAVLAIVGFHAYVQGIEPRRLLIWNQEKAPSRVVKFRVVDVDALRPLEDAEKSARGIDEGALAVLVAAGVVDEVGVSSDRPAGRAPWAAPRSMSGLSELLVLAETLDSRQHLWIVRPKDGWIDVVPQDWFSDGPYDFGYQWITRMARDPKSGRIIGEGIRLGLFALDETNRRVSEWGLEWSFWMAGSWPEGPRSAPAKK